jgi:hypothetical protein
LVPTECVLEGDDCLVIVPLVSVEFPEAGLKISDGQVVTGRNA